MAHFQQLFYHRQAKTIPCEPFESLGGAGRGLGRPGLEAPPAEPRPPPKLGLNRPRKKNKRGIINVMTRASPTRRRAGRNSAGKALARFRFD